MDGSPIEELAIELESVKGPALTTRVRVRDVAALGSGSRSASCLREEGWSLPPSGRSVERVGVAAESVTFRGASGRSVFGCDSSLGPREGDRSWCGGAFGAVQRGRLRDPRLDIGCSTFERKPIGLAWIEPSARTTYVVVAQPGYSEVYEVAAGLPVRVATIRDVDLERSAATFDVSEHDASGHLLQRYQLDAVVAG